MVLNVVQSIMSGERASRPAVAALHPLIAVGVSVPGVISVPGVMIARRGSVTAVGGGSA